MSKTAPFITRLASCAAFAAALTLSACTEEPTAPVSPLIPPEPPANPQIRSAAWIMDVNRTTGVVRVTPPSRGLEESDLQILADFFGIEPGSPDLSILAGDVVEILTVPGSFQSSAVGAFTPGLVRTTFDVQVRNRLTGVNILTSTFPAPPAGAEGVVLFPFQVTVTETPGGATGGQGDGTEVLVELPNRGEVAPSTDWDLDPFNFFNDTGCSATDNDCYRSEVFAQPLLGGATSEAQNVGFDHEPTVSQFRVRMILAGDLEDATPNTPPTADAGGPYSGGIGVPITLAGSGTDPDVGGAIASYAWDFDNDGAFDDATGQAPTFTCTTGGTFPIALQVLDNRGAPATDASEVTCADTAPIAEAGGPYSGFVGTPITLNGSGTDDGTIVSYAWDFNADGVFDDAAVQNPEFTCAALGQVTVSLRVTDDGSQTGDDSATIDCADAPLGQINGRWVDAAGTPITSAAVGSTVHLQIDADMGSNVIDLMEGTLQYENSLAQATAGADLNCFNLSCPSGTGTSTDVLTFFTVNTGVVDHVIFNTFSVAGNGTGIQGIADLTFTVNAAGTLSPVFTEFVAASDAGANVFTLPINIPSLTITP